MEKANKARDANAVSLMGNPSLPILASRPAFARTHTIVSKVICALKLNWS